MAFYRTTDTELTSIADAIRVKTGNNSPLVYPTGFINAIGGLTSASYNWLGEDALLIYTPYEQTIKLSDTDFNASSVTTSNTTILAQANLTQVNVSTDWDYVVKILGYVNYQYSGTPTLSALITDGCYCGIINMGKKPYTLNEFINQTDSTFVYATNTSYQQNLYYTSNSKLYTTANIYGISFSSYNPSFSSADDSTVSITLKTPAIRISSNANYMSQASINALDPNNTTIYMKIELYRINKTGLFHGILNEHLQLYKNAHNLT